MARTRKLVIRRKIESVRERADKQQAKSDKPSRQSKAKNIARGPVAKLHGLLTIEYHPVKLPNSKVGRSLTKSRKTTPSYFKDSVGELKQVEWPARRQALSLSMAVIVFSVVIAIFVKLLDFGLGKLFKEVILK